MTENNLSLFDAPSQPEPDRPRPDQTTDGVTSATLRAEPGIERVLPPDEQARRVIRGEDGYRHAVVEDPHIVLEKNLVVRAGAGSGKTRSLVDRMVALVRSGVPARRVAAITFTIKAAGELRTRFAQTLGKARVQLEGRIAMGDDPSAVAPFRKELDRVVAAERSLEHMFIGTVHAFCGRLLRERPFEAGLSPDFGHVDPGMVMAHRRRFWAGFVARSADRWLDRLEDVDLDPSDLFEFFSQCVNNEDVPLEGLTLRPPLPDLGPACQKVEEFVATIVKTTEGSPGEDSMLKRVRALSRHIDREGSATPALKAAILQRAAGLGSTVTLKDWGSKDSDAYALARTVKNTIKEFIATVVEPSLSAWWEYVFFDAGQYVQEAVKEYAVLRRRTGEQTFDDLLWGARRMLEKSPENRAHFSRKFSHILVDEFQDTDPVQAEILLFLCSTNQGESRPWRCIPRPGSLFVVGDDKQSIYRFRRADVEVFARFESVLLEHGGQRVDLTTNFRSDARICDFVNRSLMPAFSDPLKDWQAAWEDLVPFEHTAARAHTEPVIRIGIPGDTRKSRSHLVGEGAPRVAAAIGQLVRSRGLNLDGGSRLDLAGPVGFGDVMVLFRTAAEMPAYAAELNRLAIPYAISGGKTLGKTESLQLILNPLDALLKEDSVALLAFLRGPCCGVSDTELMDFVEAGGSLRMPLRPDGMVRPGPELAAGLDMLADLKTRLGRMAPADALDTWVQEQGILAGLAAALDGAGSAGSLVRVLALVRSWDASGMSWPEMVEELHRLQDDDIEAEQLTLDALSGHAVNLMTVHQAKGLEAKVVILADPAGTGRSGSDIFIDRSGSEPTLSARVMKYRDILAWTPGWKEREIRDLQLEEAEELRLTYVAATRAEELLLIAHHPRTDGAWSAFDRHLLNVPTFSATETPAPASDDLLDVEAALASAEAFMRESADRREILMVPTYATASPSADEAPDGWYSQTGEGRGKTYGTLVHRLFESMVIHRERALDGSWIQRVAARHANETIETDQRAQRTAEAMHAAEDLLNSPVWKALRAADEIHSELPYVFAIPATAQDPETLHSGIMDLVWRTDDAWHIVDYKTDALDASDLATKHGAQLREYARALKQLAGAEDIRLGIWSTHNAELIQIDYSGSAE